MSSSDHKSLTTEEKNSISESGDCNFNLSQSSGLGTDFRPDKDLSSDNEIISSEGENSLDIAESMIYSEKEYISPSSDYEPREALKVPLSFKPRRSKRVPRAPNRFGDW